MTKERLFFNIDFSTTDRGILHFTAMFFIVILYIPRFLSDSAPISLLPCPKLMLLRFDWCYGVVIIVSPLSN